MRLLFLLLISLSLTTCSNTVDEKSNKIVNKTQTANQIELTSDSLLENKFNQLTKQAIRDSSVTFRVDTLTNFEWDTLIIIPTYWNIERLELETQINLSAAKKAGQYREDLNILAFTKNRQLIKCIELPRTKGDFATLKSVIFSRENCVFEFVRTTNKFLASGQPVVEGRIPR